jgi:TfoX/Sxy family transcriptional regulator of competence genes
MAKASLTLIDGLKKTLNNAAVGLTAVVEKTMFGCHSLFTNDAVFSMVWKDGRIGVRLPEVDTYSQLMSESGAGPWRAGTRTMSHWVLVPKSMHHSQAELARWVAKAHAYAMQGVGKSQTAPKRKKKVTKVRAISRAAAPRTKMTRVRR